MNAFPRRRSILLPLCPPAENVGADSRRSRVAGVASASAPVTAAITIESELARQLHKSSWINRKNYEFLTDFLFNTHGSSYRIE
jgi:hypothetical protein